MNTLLEYASELVNRAGKTLLSGEMFAKILTPNDDSGRHGVLVPSDAYAFFPNLPIPAPALNATAEFDAFDVLSANRVLLKYKYYQRYPERRITRLHSLINDRTNEPRLVVFLRAYHTDGTSAYYFDCANSAPDGRFSLIFRIMFGNEASTEPGTFVMRPVDSAVFSADAVLSELVRKFDAVNIRGWVDSLRKGDTGIGYTFETLLGIKENNDKIADFKGIEIKCKSVKEGAVAASGKINLFQQGPVWLTQQSAKERIQVIGRRGQDGLFSCHSQVTTAPNNLGLSLEVVGPNRKIDLRKHAVALGQWAFDTLENRLREKHSRAVIVKATMRKKEMKSQFRYDELVYCERPSIERFVALVGDRNIVFEFLMSEKTDGTIRNHGYPWRLIREEFLDHLFLFKIKLR